LAKFFLLAESKALVEIFLRMESKLIFDGPIFFYTRLFFGGLQVRPTVLSILKRGDIEPLAEILSIVPLI
jgi:hypothetical protein